MAHEVHVKLKNQKDAKPFKVSVSDHDHVPDQAAAEEHVRKHNPRLEVVAASAVPAETESAGKPLPSGVIPPAADKVE